MSDDAAPIADVDVWRAAKLPVDRYGDGATVEAMKRVDALAAQGEVAAKHQVHRAGTLSHGPSSQALEAPQRPAQG